ncbi:hypothetical protein VTI74DRAFT_1696 [Chaetomium olivicolor]
MDYAQLPAFSRVLPEPLRQVLVTKRGRPVASPVSPVSPLPNTPLRHRGRQRSTDSALSDILNQTEQRLREGSVSGSIRSDWVASSPAGTTPNRVLGPREYRVPASRIRTPSRNKIMPSPFYTPTHERQESQQSTSSGTDNLLGEEYPVADPPSGLTRLSRHYQKLEAEQPLLREQSVRTSLSSELSTLYSEDEIPEKVKKAIMPLEGLVEQP